jgi:hypothetical protein
VHTVLVDPVAPRWDEEVTSEPAASDLSPERKPRSTIIVLVGALVFLVAILFVIASPERGPDPVPEQVVLSDGPLLGYEVSQTMIATSTEGTLLALDLDSGVLITTEIFTDHFVTVGERLIVRTPCGGWQAVDMTSYTLDEPLIGCGSYLPYRPRGAETMMFTRSDSDHDILIADDDSRMLSVSLSSRPSYSLSSIAAVSGTRLLAESTVDGLVWLDPTSGETENYSSGGLIEATAGGVLWTDCPPTGRCDVWIGTPDEPRLSRIWLASVQRHFPARLNSDASRAVFFKEGDVLRIITLETGNSREVENPGIDWNTATWSTDGLWLVDARGATIVALNTLNGDVVRIEDLPYDPSLRAVALIASP